MTIDNTVRHTPIVTILAVIALYAVAVYGNLSGKLQPKPGTEIIWYLQYCLAALILIKPLRTLKLSVLATVLLTLLGPGIVAATYFLGHIGNVSASVGAAVPHSFGHLPVDKASTVKGFHNDMASFAIVITFAIGLFLLSIPLRRHRLSFLFCAYAVVTVLTLYLLSRQAEWRLYAVTGFGWFLMIYAVLTWLRMRQSTVWKRTPYDQIGEDRRLAHKEQRAHGKDIDVFLSYKSEDIGVVRQVADLLIASGLTVWFAEYLIGLDDREYFEEDIKHGIWSSRYGICFTNNRYAGSDYCRGELLQLIEPHGCGPERMMEVMIPSEPMPREQCPGLASVALSFDYAGSVDEVVRRLYHMMGLPANLPADPKPTESQQSAVLRYEDLCWTVAIGGWQLWDAGGQEYVRYFNGQRHVYGVSGPSFRCCVKTHRLVGNVIIGRGCAAPRVQSDAPIDERKSYNENIKFANDYFRSSGTRCVGVHLVFLAGYSHLALTYFYHGAWTRRYSIVLPDPSGDDGIELAFTFRFGGPFSEYCRHVHLMDRLVSSLRWNVP